MNKKISISFIVVCIGALIFFYFNAVEVPIKDVVEKTPPVVIDIVPKETTVTKPATTKPAASTPVVTDRDTDGVRLVTYTSKGFTPFIIEVSLGESVRFVNNRNDRALWVTSTHPQGANEYYPGFSGAKSLSKGESFTVPFTKAGAWSYKNLNDASHQGVILVK